MVFAFIIQTVHPSFCQVLHSQVFSHDDISDAEPEAGRRCRKAALQQVADRVAAECDFLRQTGSGVDGGAPTQTGMLALGPLFGRPKHALWCSALSTAFVLVLESQENRVLAHAALQLLAKHLRQALLAPATVLLRPDTVLAVVKHVMPEGQLLFLNSTAVGRMDRELEKDILQQGS